MIVITQEKGFYSKIEGLEKHVLNSLRKLFSYKDDKHIMAQQIFLKKKGFIPKYLSWDGVIYLIENDGKYPTGLTNSILSFLKNHQLTFKLIDNTKFLNNKKQLKIKSVINLRDHQLQALKEIKKHKIGIINACVGYGKTKTSVVACEEISAFPFLFIVHRLSLLKQTHKEFSDCFDEAIGFLGNGMVDVQDINIASIATICSVLKIKHKIDEKEKTTYSEEQIQQVQDLLRNCRFIIHDEVHHSAAITSQTILKEINNADYKIGLSGTPWRNTGDSILLEASFGPVIYKKTASDLIQKKYLTQPKISFIQYSDSEKEILFPINDKSENYNKVYKQCIVDNEEYNMMVANLAILNTDKNRSILISVKHVEHGKNLIKAFEKYNNPYEVIFLHGNSKEKYIDESLKRFKSKDLKILISTIMDEGVDISSLDVAINAGAGSSAIKMIQLVGRVLRNHPGKKFAYVYDFIHPYSYLFGQSKKRIEILQTEPEFLIKLVKL